MKKILLFFVGIFLGMHAISLAECSSCPKKTEVIQRPFRPKDSIPDKKDFTVAQDGRHVRKGTFKAFVDNVFLLDQLTQLPKGKEREKNIEDCVNALAEIAQDLYSVGIFDRVFTINEWVQNDQKVGRIIATLACLKEFICQLDQKNKILIQTRLQKLQLIIDMPEVQGLTAAVLAKLNNCKKCENN